MQPVVVARGCGMNLCRFQVVVIVVILVLIILLFVIAFLALTCCIMGAVWIAAVCGIGSQCWSRCRMWIAALLKHDCRLACMAISTGYLLICLGWLSLFSVSVVSKQMFRIFICIDHDAFWRRV